MAKNNAVICQDCKKETADPDLEGPAVRCQHCGSVNVLWKERRTLPIFLSHGDQSVGRHR